MTDNRCQVTGNPVGTDTWAENYECPCRTCRRYVEGIDSPAADDPFRELYETLPECGRPGCAARATQRDVDCPTRVRCDQHVRLHCMADLPWAHIVRREEGGGRG